MRQRSTPRPIHVTAMQILQQPVPFPLVHPAIMYVSRGLQASKLLQTSTIRCKNITFEAFRPSFSDAQLQLLKVKGMMQLVRMFF
jgi:hypothetical protein